MLDAPARRGTAILVVDDDTEVRETLVDAVESTGRPVFSAANGLQALQLLRDHIPRPCLVLLDWHMEPVSGEEFLRTLHTWPDAEQIPVVIMSASARRPFEQRDLRGVVAVMRKPFGIEDIAAVLDEHA
jgi:CheY-like chemotaxis protein